MQKPQEPLSGFCILFLCYLIAGTVGIYFYIKMNSSIVPPVCANQSIGISNTLISLMTETIITASQCNLSPSEMWPTDYGPYIDKLGLGKYDFIIVGAGSAGSVLANRLTENPSWKVLVLEAGENPPAESEIPFMNPFLTSTKFSWNFNGETSTNFGYAYPAGVGIPAGKMLGGTGSLNGMVYVRGNRRDYDRWEADGNTSWNWHTVFKYFKKSEKMLSKEILQKSGLQLHGLFGPMKIDLYRDYNPNPLDAVLTKGLGELGLQDIVDYNADEHIGYARIASFTANGVRQSSGKVFLGAARNRRNLDVIKHAHVTSLITGKCSKILGVKFTINGTKEYTARASKEYILSAGIFNTPQILMLSGIGPREHLKNHRIPVYRDLQVGRNLQDHVILSYQFTIPNYRSPVKYDVLEEYRRYLKFRKGAFSGPYTADLNAFINTINRTSPFPNLQMVYVIADQRSIELTKHNSANIGTTPDVLNATIIATMLLLNPRSRGYVKLRSRDPFDSVRIYPDLLTDREDIEELVKAVRWQQDLLKTETFKRFNFTAANVSVNTTAEFDSDQFWEMYIRSIASPGWHTVGTCKMGPKTDPEAVVDPRLKVHRINNLRVVDASVIPYVPSGNTYAATLMIAERAADFIKDDWRRLTNAVY